MESIKFLSANNKIYRINFINILKKVTNMEVAQLSEKYNDLLNSKSANLELI